MIYIARHGETDWNIKHIIQGQHETNLTQKGIEQAEALKEKLKNVKFDAVFASPLSRTYNTCRIIVGQEKEIIKEPCLMERDFGEIVGKSDDFMSFWNTSVPRDAKGLESIKQMEDRIFPFINKIVKEYKQKNVLIVSHQGPCFIFENYFGYAPTNGDYKPLRLTGCGYRIYDPVTKEKKEYGLSQNG